MKPSRINPTGGISGGNPPVYPKAKVNILSTGVIMVNLLVRPLEKNLMSAGPLKSDDPALLMNLNHGDIVFVVRNADKKTFSFKGIAERAPLPLLAEAVIEETTIAPITYPPIFPANIKAAARASAIAEGKREDATPTSIEFDETAKSLTNDPAASPQPPRSKAQAPSGVYKAVPSILGSAPDVALVGKEIKGKLIKNPTDEIRAEALSWIKQAEEMAACFIAETSKEYPASLAEKRPYIISISETRRKLYRLLGQTPSELRIPVPVDISMDITPKVDLAKALASQPSAPKPATPKPSVPKPAEPPVKKAHSPELSPEEEEIRRIFDKYGRNTPIDKLFIEVQSLLNAGLKASRTLEHIRSAYQTVILLLAEGRFDAECNAGEFDSHIEINRELYRQTFKNFAAKFERYLNAKDIDPMRLIDNYFRTGNIDHVFKACRKYEILFLEKKQMNSEDQKMASDLAVWLNFILASDNLRKEYPGFKSREVEDREDREREKHFLRRTLASLEKYLQSDQR